MQHLLQNQHMVLHRQGQLRARLDALTQGQRRLYHCLSLLEQSLSSQDQRRARDVQARTTVSAVARPQPIIFTGATFNPYIAVIKPPHNPVCLRGLGKDSCDTHLGFPRTAVFVISVRSFF